MSLDTSNLYATSYMAKRDKNIIKLITYNPLGVF